MTYRMKMEKGIDGMKNRGEYLTSADGRPRIFVFSVMTAKLFFQKAD